MATIPHTVQQALTGEHRELLRHKIKENAQQDTPLGAICKTMRVPTELPSPPQVLDYICPLAFLWKLCFQSRRFFELLQRCPGTGDPAQPGIVARLCLYLDDVMPGNQHRPDSGRSYVAIYWTLLDLPDWMLHSTNGWFVLAFVPKKIWLKVPGEQSGLMAHLLKAFWPEDELSFATSFAVVNGEDSLALRAQEIAIWLLDGDAVPKVTTSKTMSAFKCCCRCRNVVARIAADKIPEGTPFVFRVSYAKVDFEEPGGIVL